MIANKYREVTRREFLNFLDSYPGQLEQTLYMDWYIFTDLSTGVHVAMASIYDDMFKIADGSKQA